jgi:predicted transcriptional regulator
VASKASTHRLDPSVQEALNHLSILLKRPKNRLINEAVKLYIEQKSQEVEQELEGTLKALRAYRRLDPDFKGSIDAFVDAEAKLAASDPAEGGPKMDKGALQAEIRRKLHAV